MTFGFTFQGGQEMAARIRALPLAVGRSVMREALKKAAEPMAARMSSLARRAPGPPDIADNIVISETTRVGSTEGGKWFALSQDQVAVAIGPAKKGFAYGIPLEFGSIHARPHPFVRPGYDQTVDEAFGILRDEIWAALREQSGRSSFSPGGTGTL